MTNSDIFNAILTYPCPPPSSSLCQSGRLIDEEHWTKVAGIFPIERNHLEEDLHLDDTSHSCKVYVQDGRRQQPSLNKEGFTLVSTSPTRVDDFANHEEVERLYLPETTLVVEKAVQAATSVKPAAVVPFHWLVRDSRRSNYDSSKGPITFNGQSHAPVCRVHGDYTVENAPLRFIELQEKGLLPPEWDLATSHWGIMNVWRNVSDTPIRSMPLAVLDCTSISLDEIFQYWLVRQDGSQIGRNLAISYKDNHRWLYFPAMEKSEALVFFTFEHLRTSNSTKPRSVFHTAFETLDSSETMKGENETPPYRVSIETRCLVVFEPSLK